ncbi:FAD-binding oxidoreductase [Rhodopirellula sp. SWK7]|uniref:FAD-binding oxidoreductase n=1 Tax=Rhodopirellula sp. SWK7 TaxID=595460 RepID=UPI0002C03437|nr:FAD-binding oxidoreductase [Rhodopirellula sp. SWK7]EMI44578.1 FAD linked oxidase domain-containing protein [Rhodopirellula sp. SWK7]
MNLTQCDSGSLEPVTNPIVAPSDLAVAIQAWKELLGQQRVVEDHRSLDQHGKNAYGSPVRSVVVLRPSQASEVESIVRVSRQYRVPLYPISTGRNWGYGSASPVEAGCAVVDLSELTRIRIVDAELGIVALQPGVTQGMLAEFLEREGLNLMVPVHGGGPTCSLLGNALERGYGLTPTTDHFQALTSLEAVLPDGSLYRSPFHAMGAETIGSAHRWGIGPYVEGLFSQGNFGIVTEATFTLQRRPEHVEAFFLRISDSDQLSELVDELRTLLSSMGATVAGVNLMNDRRVLSMSRAYPVEQVPQGEIISDSLCQQMSKEAGISAWTAAGVIHCPYSMRRSVRRELKRLIPNCLSRPIHMNRGRVRWARRLMQWMPAGKQSILQQLSSIEALLDLADGIPRRVALPLAYWLEGRSPQMDQDLNPAQDDCGLIWYSPLVPMKSEDVDRYVEMVTRVCTDHGIEPLITLTSLSERLFDSTVPILYQPRQAGATERAHACYASLCKEGKSLGYLPYRVGTRSMQNATNSTDGSHWDLVNKLKQAVDPDHLISPGRYCSRNKRI